MNLLPPEPRAASVPSVSTERSWCLLVPQHAQGARIARHRLGEKLDGAIPAALLADAEMVAAELLGNAVRHAPPLPGGMIRLTWLLRTSPTAHTVEIRVTDGGAAGPPRMRRVGPEATDGRGLLLVAALATDWGVERNGLGQSVWARLVHPVRDTIAVR